MADKRENPQITCEIIQDLLPLYHDGVVSEKTGEAIKNHLEQCAACRKEYDMLCAELPIETSEPSTKKQFINMVHRHKRKQLFITILSSVLACVMLIGAYFGQMQLPISNVADDEITVQRVYRYETDEGYKYFILYNAPAYNNSTGDVSAQICMDGYTLIMNIKKPLISNSNTGLGLLDNVWVYNCGFTSGDNGKLNFYDYAAVEFAGNIVWEREANAADDIPDYVYAYEDFEEPGGEVRSFSISSENGYLEASYYDGYIIRWDLDGNVLYDSRSNKGE